MGAIQEDRKRKNGQPYIINKIIPGAFEYTANITDIVRAINADPDIPKDAKAFAIKKLGGMDTPEAAKLIDKLYKAAYGTNPNNETPLSIEIRKLIRPNRALW
jgi:hypothetical protein